jgi:hypothetical protein
MAGGEEKEEGDGYALCEVYRGEWSALKTKIVVLG